MREPECQGGRHVGWWQCSQALMKGKVRGFPAGDRMPLCNSLPHPQNQAEASSLVPSTLFLFLMTLGSGFLL